jgi:hypothetical protein
MHRDFKELFACLNAEGVRYLVVGGYAVSLHAEPRATKDLDILVDPAPKMPSHCSVRSTNSERPWKE